MFLCIVRHGDAYNVGDPGVTCDDDRHLTPDGIATIEAVGACLATLSVEPQQVWSSPLERARETAQIICTQLGFEGEIRESHVLAGGPAGPVVEALNDAEDLKSLVLVGHNPQLSDLCNLLLFGRGTLAIDLGKGDAAAVHCPSAQPGTAALEWLLPGSVALKLAATS